MKLRDNIEYRTPAEPRMARHESSFDGRCPMAKVRGCSRPTPADRGSVLVIVLLIAFGLIGLTLYLGDAMSLELRASDNRTAMAAADQTIEGAARYVALVLATWATNGAVPFPAEYQAEAVPIGNSRQPEENAHFWIIGRDTSGTFSSEPWFALIDESSKLDLNAPWLTADTLQTNLIRMTYDLAQAIVDWRATNSSSMPLNYGLAGYEAKHAPFETVEELRLVYGATLDALVGKDLNRNGILDPIEQRGTLGAELEPGLLEYFTVYTFDPNTRTDGSALTNVNSRTDLQALLETRVGSSRATEILTRLFPPDNPPGSGQGTGPGSGQGTAQSAGAAVSYTNLLQFFLASGMTSDEFASVYSDLCTTNTPVIGRVNVNTAPAPVLACLPGMDAASAVQLVNYRETSGANLSSIAWIVDALGSDNGAVRALARGDYITTHSYQYTADIAAVGPHGRGYRRVKFIFDLSEGSPKIIYRQDLSHLGWALGQKTREMWVTQNTR